MDPINVLAVPIRPELPKVIDHEQIFVYIPAASTSGSGVATFDSNYFSVDKNGLVSLKLSTEIAQNDFRPIASDTVFRALNDIAKALSKI